MSKHLVVAIVVALGLLVTSSQAHAQSENPDSAKPADPLLEPLEPSDPQEPAPQSPAPRAPAPQSPAATPSSAAPIEAREQEPEMSEGRQIVSLYNSGFQWGLSPGIVFAGGKTSFFLGARVGWGFDLGKVILVPGVRLAGFFTDPNVYVGMPVMKVVLPIDRFAPFVEGGAGIGHVSGFRTLPADSGLALFGGVGFMVHFSYKFGLGVEGTYQVITGTGFDGFGIGPILAIGF